MNNKLSELRKQIDSVDSSIVKLLAERLKLVKKVGEWKKKNKLPPLDSKRWEAVLLSKIKMANRLKIPKDLIVKIFEAIHEESLKIEKSI